jgi:phosphoglycerol transferase MdoB-like AlkP superfamily enzyme
MMNIGLLTAYNWTMSNDLLPVKPLKWWQYILLGIFYLILVLGIVALGIMNGAA